MWYCAREFVRTQLPKASPWAIILVTPYILHRDSQQGLFHHWVAATSVVPHTEQVAQSVADALLQFAYHSSLLPHITVDVWSWLKTQPSLPPVCWGRYLGGSLQLFKAIQGLSDIETLKSYLLVVWSEWDTLWDNGFDKMCTLIHEDFGETWMGHHRTDLIQQLDHIIGKLDQGLEYLQQHNPNLNTGDFWKMKYQYGKLKRILLEMNVKAVTRMSGPTPMLFSALTHMDVHRIPCNIYVCTALPMSIASIWKLGPCSFPLPHSNICTQTPIYMLICHTSCHALSLSY